MNREAPLHSVAHSSPLRIVSSFPDSRCTPLRMGIRNFGLCPQCDRIDSQPWISPNNSGMEIVTDQPVLAEPLPLTPATDWSQPCQMVSRSLAVGHPASRPSHTGYAARRNRPVTAVTRDSPVCILGVPAA